MENMDIVTDVDLTQRSDDEWSDIYHVQLVDGDIDTNPIDEFNWAYKLVHSKYFLKPSANAKEMDYSIAEQMEMRAMKINRDLFAMADRAEKEMLNCGKYVQIKYVLDYKVK